MSAAFRVYLYGPEQGPIDSSFESAQQRLENLPGLFFELDGSFAWMREPKVDEVYGILYDASGVIRYCELHGNCRRSTWCELCEAIAGGSLSDLQVLQLPDRRLQDFQSFADSLDSGSG